MTHHCAGARHDKAGFVATTVSNTTPFPMEKMVLTNPVGLDELVRGRGLVGISSKHQRLNLILAIRIRRAAIFSRLSVFECLALTVRTTPPNHVGLCEMLRTDVWAMAGRRSAKPR